MKKHYPTRYAIRCLLDNHPDTWFTAEEIVKMLGIPAGAVKTSLTGFLSRKDISSKAVGLGTFETYRTRDGKRHRLEEREWIYNAAPGGCDHQLGPLPSELDPRGPPPAFIQWINAL